MMSTPELMRDPVRAWAVYHPDRSTPWDLGRVAHLHRRAGFAASWSVLQRDLDEGPEASIQRLLVGEGESLDGQSAADFERNADRMATTVGGGGELRPLQSAWLYRMVHTPHPLRERMTLFWHDHFATSNAKVNNPGLMRRQNALFREHALGDFGALLRSVARDPAMLVWLDSAANRKAHPNENYAREVMELFTLGRGHYTEKDIQEAARAFTGSFVRGELYREVADQHDAGEKTILGRTGPFRGEDVATILLDQEACAATLCAKLFKTFVSEVDEPSAGLIAPLAEAFRSAHYDVAVPVAMILRSRLFHDLGVQRRRVKSPVELAVGTIRALEVVRPTVSLNALAAATEAMGQALFAPPSVAGWDWGPAWINTTTSLARTNFALGVVGNSGDLGRRFDALDLASRHGHSGDPRTFLVELLVQDAFGPDVRRRISGEPREVAALVLTSPEYQLA